MKASRLRKLLTGLVLLVVLASVVTVISPAGRTWLTRLVSGHECPDCNVILISIDTLRADHLGCYGYPRPTTPNIDAFSSDAALFRTAIAHAPYTVSSHASIFTSLPPGQHRLVDRETTLAPEFITLAEVLRSDGFQTVGFHGGGQVAAEFGLDQGFDVYRPWFDTPKPPQRSFARVVDLATRWMGKHSTDRFFLFLHTYEVHVPYTPPLAYLRLLEPHYAGPLPTRISNRVLNPINRGVMTISDADFQHIVNTYDAEIRSMDDAFGDLVDYLRRTDLYDRTVIVFTSDHGEEFGEHGVIGKHARTLYDELLQVPLLVKFPDSVHGGTVVDDVARSIDIGPTLLDILDLNEVDQFTGTSLVEKIISNEGEDLIAISQLGGRRGLKTAVRTQYWKLYGPALFDLRADPGEQNPLLQGHEHIRAQLQPLMDEAATWYDYWTRPKSEVKLDEATREQLRALGYID